MTGIGSDRYKAGESSATVFVVDDDADVRSAISVLVRSVGLNVELFACAQDFLNSYNADRVGCLVLDVRMPGMTGLQLQQKLVQRSSNIPIIMLTAYAEVPMAAQSLRAGAVDFIQKPFSPQTLLERINEAIQRSVETCRQEHDCRRVDELLTSLSPREEVVMGLLAEGHSTKQIALGLNISIKTVHNHRASILEKMHVDNATQLLRILHRGPHFTLDQPSALSRLV